MQRVAAVVERVADCDATVLVTGESGVGKEVIARELHRRSSRRDRPFVKVNCAALPNDLLESEMFGHERGAFTGADTAAAGKFEAAARGTIMLDEITEMPLALQAKLLHVLEDGAFTRLGSNREINPDVRVIAATNRPIAPLIADGRFREDLYYRLQVIEIFVPPLRERRDEIQPLAANFLEQFGSKQPGPTPLLSPPLVDALMSYDWPGNVRELENVIQRLVILRDERVLIQELSAPRIAGIRESSAAPAEPAAVAPDLAAPVATNGHAVAAAEEGASLPDLVRRTTDRVEREVIANALDTVRWNRRRAARMLGVSYKTLLNKMKTLGLDAEAAAVGGDA
jgi:DNA-binding NtrC family response regulator